MSQVNRLQSYGRMTAHARRLSHTAVKPIKVIRHTLASALLASDLNLIVKFCTVVAAKLWPPGRMSPMR